MDPFWREVFEALERVCKLQLVVCPWSSFHRDESLVSEMFEALKRMYEHVANGVGFLRSTEVELRQLNTAVVAWLDQRQAEYDLNPERITTGSLHRWHGRFLVSVSMNYPFERVRELRDHRSQLQRSLARWFEECRLRPDKSFDHALTIEFDGYRDVLLGTYEDMVRRENELRSLFESATGEPLPVENPAPLSGPGSEQVWLILEVFKRRAVAKAGFARLLNDFLNSEHFRKMPIHRISTLLFAAIAHSAANHQRRPPDQGTSNDINLVSAYLPYCDAMLIDNRTRSMLLTGVPRKHTLKYPCRVFSKTVGDDFLAYLKGIEDEADPFILALVRKNVRRRLVEAIHDDVQQVGQSRFDDASNHARRD